MITGSINDYVSIQLISLASREFSDTLKENPELIVSIQLISLASREVQTAIRSRYQCILVSIQLISLASRESR